MDESLRARAVAIASDNAWQMSLAEYLHIVETVAERSPCNLLVFGVGNDSELWLEANHRGKTVFLEDSAEWIAAVKGLSLAPAPVIRQCRYAPRPVQWLSLVRPKWLVRGMPSLLEAVDWDVILVDAPRGYRVWHPGRLQAIAWAAHLARVGAADSAPGRRIDLFIHDFDRRTERFASLTMVGRGNLVSVVDRLAHFTVP